MRAANGWLDRHPKSIVVVMVAILTALAGVATYNAATNSRQDTSLRGLVRHNHELAVQGKQAHDGLCALRREREVEVTRIREQIKETLAFLARHPSGIDGISRSDIETNVRSQRDNVRLQQQTIAALTVLSNCPSAKGAS